MVIVPAETAASVRGRDDFRPRLLLIETQPLILAALSGLLTAPPLFAEVLVSSTSEGMPDSLDPRAIDMVLCDRGVRPVTALELAHRLAVLAEPIPMILLGEPEDESVLIAALAAPVAGVLTKDASLDEFLAAVRGVLAGHRVIGRRVMAALLTRSNDVHRLDAAGGTAQLSPTELDILTMVGRAESIASIAERRGISHKTVRNHLTNICRKLHLRGRSEAMLWAARTGLTTPLPLGAES